MPKDLLLYGIAAFSFLFGLWFIVLGSFDVAAGRNNPLPVTVEYDSHPIVHSLITGGLWTISLGIIFLLHPHQIGQWLIRKPFLAMALNSSGILSDMRIVLLIVCVLNSLLANSLRTFVRSRTKLEIDLPPGLLEKYRNR